MNSNPPAVTIGRRNSNSRVAQTFRNELRMFAKRNCETISPLCRLIVFSVPKEALQQDNRQGQKSVVAVVACI